jgi:hypothetical protein
VSKSAKTVASTGAIVVAIISALVSVWMARVSTRASNITELVSTAKPLLLAAEWAGGAGPEGKGDYFCDTDTRVFNLGGAQTYLSKMTAHVRLGTDTVDMETTSGDGYPPTPPFGRKYFSDARFAILDQRSAHPYFPDVPSTEVQPLALPLLLPGRTALDWTLRLWFSTRLPEQAFDFPYYPNYSYRRASIPKSVSQDLSPLTVDFKLTFADGSQIAVPTIACELVKRSSL